jgi:hypothetical protein
LEGGRTLSLTGCIDAVPCLGGVAAAAPARAHRARPGEPRPCVPHATPKAAWTPHHSLHAQPIRQQATGTNGPCNPSSTPTIRTCTHHGPPPPLSPIRSVKSPTGPDTRPRACARAHMLVRGRRGTVCPLLIKQGNTSTISAPRTSPTSPPPPPATHTPRRIPHPHTPDPHTCHVGPRGQGEAAGAGKDHGGPVLVCYAGHHTPVPRRGVGLRAMGDTAALRDTLRGPRGCVLVAGDTRWWCGRVGRCL